MLLEVCSDVSDLACPPASRLACLPACLRYCRIIFIYTTRCIGLRRCSTPPPRPGSVVANGRSHAIVCTHGVYTVRTQWNKRACTHGGPDNRQLKHLISGCREVLYLCIGCLIRAFRCVERRGPMRVLPAPAPPLVFPASSHRVASPSTCAPFLPHHPLGRVFVSQAKQTFL